MSPAKATDEQPGQHRSTGHALFPPTYRLLFYCIVIGIFGAVAAEAFDFMVRFGERLLLGGIAGYHLPVAGTLAPVVEVPAWSHRWWIPLVTTLGGLVSGFIVFRWAPEAEGHGTDAAIAAYHRGGEIRSRIPFIKAVASAVTIGTGGVAGKEGPTAQITTGLGAMFGKLMGVRGQERRTLLLASMAAGLSAVFRAPLGMAIFAVEVLYSEMVFESEALIYTVIAAVTAYALHGFWAGWSPIFVIPAGLGFDRPVTLVAYAILGVVSGLVAASVPAVFYGVRRVFLRLPILPHFKPAIGGFLVGCMALAVPGVLGTGYGWVELALAGSLPVATMLLILVLRVPAMALTIGSGGSGGVFGPTVAMGAMLGGAMGALFVRYLPQLGVQPAAFVLVGMAAVFAGAARTPISTLIMVAEMTGGYGLIVPTMLAATISFLVQGSLASKRDPSLYSSQVETREESPAHRGVFVRRAIQLVEEGGLDPAELTLPRLVTMLQYGEPIPVGTGQGLLVTLGISEGSRLAGTSVQQSIGGVDGATAVAVLRGGQMLVPRGPTRLEVGDDLILIVTPKAHQELRAASRTSG